MIKHIKPGSPEFAAIAATITPIERVRKEAFPKTVVFAEIQTNCRISRRRRESVDKLR